MMNKGRWFRMIPVLALGLVLALAIGAAAAQQDTAPQGEPQAFLGFAFEADADGVLVTRVLPEGPADQAGLLSGDIITAVNGDTVTVEDIVSTISSLNVGDTVDLSVSRDDETIDLTATLGERGDFLPPANGQMPNMPGMPQMPFGNIAQQRVWLGIGLDANVDGVVIREVAPESPAAAAGLLADDVITAVNGQAVSEPQQAIDIIQALNPGDTVTLDITRAGEAQTVEVTLEEGRGGMHGFPGGRGNGNMPFDFEMRGMMPTNGRLGVAFEPLTAELASEQNVDVTEGALITEVQPESPAADAGLQVNDIVTAVNGEAVDEEHTLRDRMIAYEPDDTVTLSVLRAGETQELSVTLDAPDFSEGFDMPFMFGIPNMPDGEAVPAEPAAPMM